MPGHAREWAIIIVMKMMRCSDDIVEFFSAENVEKLEAAYDGRRRAMMMKMTLTVSYCTPLFESRMMMSCSQLHDTPGRL